VGLARTASGGLQRTNSFEGKHVGKKGKIDHLKPNEPDRDVEMPGESSHPNVPERCNANYKFREGRGAK